MILDGLLGHHNVARVKRLGLWLLGPQEDNNFFTDAVHYS